MASGFRIRQPRCGRCTQGNLGFETSHKTEDGPEDWGRPGVVSLLLHEKCDLGPGLSGVFQVLAMAPPR